MYPSYYLNVLPNVLSPQLPCFSEEKGPPAPAHPLQEAQLPEHPQQLPDLRDFTICLTASPTMTARMISTIIFAMRVAPLNTYLASQLRQYQTTYLS